MQDEKKQENPQQASQQAKNQQESQASKESKEIEQLKSQLAVANSERMKFQKIATEVAENPQLVELLKHQSQGKKVRVVVDEEKSAKAIIKNKYPISSSEEDEYKSIDELKPRQLIDLIGEAIEEHAEQLREKILDETNLKFGQVSTTLSTIGKILKEQVNEKRFDAARSAFPDFNKFEGAVQKLVVEKGLSPEEAYYLAKGQMFADKSQESPNEIYSERPNTGGLNPRRAQRSTESEEAIEEAAKAQSAGKTRFRDLVRTKAFERAKREKL